MSARPDTAGIRIPPPVIPLGCIGLAVGLHMAFDLPAWAPVPLRLAGVALVALAIAGSLWVAITMARAGTHAEPWRPSVVLVAHGPFRWSRNPMYASFLVGQTGLALAGDWWLGFVLLPVAWAGLRFAVIAKEEPYLRRRFGPQYDAYAARVRRWL